MKNTIKKILSVLLTAIMLLSAIPMAYAERATYSPEVEEYIYNSIKAAAYGQFNRYETSEQHTKVSHILAVAISECEAACGYEIIGGFDYDYLNDPENSKLLTGASYYNDALSAAFNEIEEKIANGEIVVELDITEAVMLALYMDSHYSKSDIYRLWESCESFNSDIYVEYKNAYNDLDNADLDLLTQAELDFLAGKLNSFYPFIYNCLDGIHNYGEYISNNDATETADGTKTATCEFCGATDTVIDEGSKLGSAEDNCSCNCHKSGISGFFWKILRFFYQLFGTNKICACGAAHY